MRCFSETAIRNHRGPDTTLATRTDGYFGIKIGIDRAMACLAARIHKGTVVCEVWQERALGSVLQE